jgi:hypothetical protein
MNICYSYYENVEKIERNYSQLDLIDVCRKSWEPYGWQLKIISEIDAKKNDFYEEYKKYISKVPSINPDGYDYHCFMRWLAMVVVGGGLMIDYDVVNLGFSGHENLNLPGLTVYQRHVPCMVSGTKEDYLETSKSFCALAKSWIEESQPLPTQIINKKPHCSDMHMLASGKIKYNSFNIVSDYPNIGNLVHCSQGSCQNKTKLEIMKELTY